MTILGTAFAAVVPISRCLSKKADNVIREWKGQPPLKSTLLGLSGKRERLQLLLE